MNFFQQLQTLGTSMDLVLRIKAKDGTITVSIEPQGKNVARVKPLMLTGTAAEIDDAFFDQIEAQNNAIAGLITNLDEVKKDAAAKSTEKPKEAASPSGKPSNKKKPKPAAKKTETKAEKAAARKKAAAKDKPAKPAKPEKKVPPPAPVVGDMFSAPIADPEQDPAEQANESQTETTSEDLPAETE